jgi:hypothetical protein
MRRPSGRLRLWVAMVAVAIFAGVTAEMSNRRQRLWRLCITHHERADTYFDRVGRICKFGETPASIEAFYRRQGPLAWRDYQTGLYHSALADHYDKAASRPWLPGLAGLPPVDGLRDVRSLAEWGLEAVMEAIPIFGFFALLFALRAGATKSVVPSFEPHG